MSYSFYIYSNYNINNIIYYILFINNNNKDINKYINRKVIIKKIYVC